MRIELAPLFNIDANSASTIIEWGHDAAAQDHSRLPRTTSICRDGDPYLTGHIGLGDHVHHAADFAAEGLRWARGAWCCSGGEHHA